MRFNRKKSDDIASLDKSHHFVDQNRYDSNDDNDYNNKMIAIDNIKVDDQTRLTFTKRVKNVFPVFSGDIIAIYQDIVTKHLVFKVQREEKIVDSWLVKRNNITTTNTSLADSYYRPNLKKYNQISSSSSYPYIVRTKIKRTSNKQQQNILIVDDEEDVLLSFTSYLSSEGYAVKTFTESREALRHIIELNNPMYYQLAIIDIRMPDINGVQLYQILKIINSGIKVLFVSALDAVEELMSIFPEIKSKDIIRTPITEERFIAKVDEVISFT
jgi:CheY-like chemotaxis protein